MNRPEGISPDRYPLKTRGTIALGVDCVGEVGETFKVNGVEFYSPEYLQRAIQSSVEAERERIAKEVARVVDTLPTEGTVAQTLRTATAIDRIFAAIRKGA